jgi:hypothetical protein
MTPQPRIGKISEQDMSEMAVESYRQIAGRTPMTKQPQHCDEKFRELAEEWLSTYGGLSETSLTYAINDFAEMVRVAYNTNNHSAASHPAPSPCVQCLEEDRVSMMEHDAAIAAQAREKVLDELLRWSKKLKRRDYGLMHDCFHKKIESLRRTGGDE